MSFPRLFFILSFLCLGIIGGIALLRRNRTEEEARPADAIEKRIEVGQVEQVEGAPPQHAEVQLPTADRVEEFFNVGLPKFPIVETITYSRKVPWLDGKAAWVGDYASHYSTSRHFIARSLNGERDYFRQDVMNGDRFNVFREDYPVTFHLVVDLSRCQMWFYYHDEVTDERVLVKRYSVGVGRPAEKRASNYLTPLGTYGLGDKVAIYRPGVKGQYQRDEIEMIQVFGTRWIPFGEEIEGCTAPARGLGLHGCPWRGKDQDQSLEEDQSGIGRHESDGCIRLCTEDIEELFSVIISKPTQVHIVNDFFEAKLPGKEIALAQEVK